MATKTTFISKVNGKDIYAKRAEKTATGVDIDGKFSSLDGNISDINTALNSKENTSNKKQSINDSSTSDYPSSKAVADFVNSSVATNTANYISNNGEPFTSVAQLEAYTGTVTNNDYAFVTGVDSAGNTYYDRYKATVDESTTPATITWAKEYRLNNSSFTSTQWAAINSNATAEVIASIDDKVDKVAGKGLSQEDFTTTLKNKLNAIEAGAEVNVQSDWNQSDNTKDDFIKNKPTKLSDFTNDLGTDNVPTKNSNNYVKSGGVYDNEQVLVQAINELRSDVEALNENREEFDNINTNTIHTMEIPYVGESQMIISGEGAPTLEPEFVGQQYMDLTNGVTYQAFTLSSSGWKSSQPTMTITDSVVEEIWNGVFA